MSKFERILLGAVVITLSFSVHGLAGTATKTVLSASPSSTQFGQSVTLTATISPAGATGHVSFIDRGSLIGTATVGANGIAQLGTITLGTGSHSLVAVYGGNSTYARSQSAPLPYTTAATPAGTFTLPALFAGSINGLIGEVKVADFNGDGKADLAFGVNSSGFGLGVALGNGDGTFQNTIGSYGSAPSVVVDLNGDGKMDVVVVGSSANVMLGNGDGTFQQPVSYTLGFEPETKRAVAGDFNLDGNADLAVANESGSVVIVLGNGDGTLQAPVSFATGGDPKDVVAGDFNGDGIPDLALSDGYDNTVNILLGNGDGTFRPATNIPVHVGPNRILTGDFNRDGTLDLATSNMDSSDISIALGNGDGTFQSVVNYPCGNTPLSMVSADFNGDGIADIAATQENPGLVVLWGNGDGTFKAALTDTLAPGTIAVGDFNGDGRADVVGVNSDISIILGMAGALQTQSIQFFIAGSAMFGEKPFALTATSTSGLPVSFSSSTPSFCTISGSSAVIVGAGNCSITASQAGNQTYAAAVPATATLQINQAYQTITFAPIPNQMFSGQVIALSAMASSGLPVTFDATPSQICSVSGNTLRLTGAAGTCSVSADQEGNANYQSAFASQTFTIASGLSPQSVVFFPISEQVTGATVKPMVYANSGLPVSLISTTPFVCSASGTTVITFAPGTCSIAATQPGNSTYAPAAPVTQSFTVVGASLTLQTIVFGQIPPVGAGSPYNLTAWASSGLPVTFISNTPSVCQVFAGQQTHQVTGQIPGICSISATQAGNAMYAPAAPVTQTFAISLGQQLIELFNLTNMEAGSGGAMVPLSAFSDSGLPVTFTSNTPSVCSILGDQAITAATGTCIITASQDGNATWAPAQPAVQAFAVNSTLPLQTITFTAGPPSDVTVGSSFTASATTSSGLPVSFLSGTPAVCAINGTTVSPVATGLCTIVATQSGDSVHGAALTVSETFYVYGPTSQAITFPALPNVPLGIPPFAVNATASSGLPVDLGSFTANVCSMTGTYVIILAQGTCTIGAFQAGNTTYHPATPALLSFTVMAASTAPFITGVENAASYASGSIAPSSYADIFGFNLASGTADTSVSITITDSQGNHSAPSVLYSGSSQVNILIPTTAALGPATLTLTNSHGSATSSIDISNISPGLFTVDPFATVPAAQVVTTVNGSQVVTPVANCTDSGCILMPITLDPSTPSYLILYGTGIRGAASTSYVSVTIGGVLASVQYAGPQGGYPGLDQVNVLIPPTLAGKGPVSLNLSIFTTGANSVLLDFR